MSINSSSNVAQSQSNPALLGPVGVSPNYAPTQPHSQDPNHTEQDNYDGHHMDTIQSSADNTRPGSVETTNPADFDAAHARSAKEAQERCVEMDSRVAELTDRLQAMRMTMQRRKTEVVAQWKALVTAQNK
jgi:TolA-binding protein